jgi:hypothetical protein
MPRLRREAPCLSDRAAGGDARMQAGRGVPLGRPGRQSSGYLLPGAPSGSRRARRQGNAGEDHSAEEN